MVTVNPYPFVQRFDHEKNDCTVVALSIALNIPYKECHKYLKLKGRKDRQGCWFDSILGIKFQLENQLITVFGKTLQVMRFPYYDWERPVIGETKWGYEKLAPRKTVKKFLLENPNGTYIVKIRGHVFTVKDGVIYNSKNPQYCEVHYALKVY